MSAPSSRLASVASGPVLASTRRSASGPSATRASPPCNVCVVEREQADTAHAPATRQVATPRGRRGAIRRAMAALYRRRGEIGAASCRRRGVFDALEFSRRPSSEPTAADRPRSGAWDARGARGGRSRRRESRASQVGRRDVPWDVTRAVASTVARRSGLVWRIRARPELAWRVLRAGLDGQMGVSRVPRRDDFGSVRGGLPGARIGPG